jgi:hypothetical protein
MKNQRNLPVELAENPIDFAVLKKAVGQLAKSPCPTFKLPTDKDLNVGRQAKPKACTHTRIGEKPQKTEIQTYRLRKKTKNDFLKVLPTFFEQLENKKVIFHNNNYVNSIFEDYTPFFANMFLEWVKCFAILRSPYRESLIDGVILSDDKDFLTAFRLLKSQGVKPRFKPKNDDKKIWDMIQKHFPSAEFQGTDLKSKMIIGDFQFSKILNDLTEAGKLSKTKKAGFTSHFYQIIKH